MKNWSNPEVLELDLAFTANGKHDNKYEGIDGVDAHGEYNKYINKNGKEELFVVPNPEGDS